MAGVVAAGVLVEAAISRPRLVRCFWTSSVIGVVWACGCQRELVSLQPGGNYRDDLSTAVLEPCVVRAVHLRGLGARMSGGAGKSAHTPGPQGLDAIVERCERTMALSDRAILQAADLIDLCLAEHGGAFLDTPCRDRFTRAFAVLIDASAPALLAENARLKEALRGLLPLAEDSHRVANDEDGSADAMIATVRELLGEDDYERCGECGDILNDAEMPRGRCVDCPDGEL